MVHSLLEYMNGRLEKNKQEETKEKLVSGPVITISRQTGCGGMKIAKLLCERINEYSSTKWRVLSKEVFQESARHLSMNNDELYSKLLAETSDDILKEMLLAFGDPHAVTPAVVRKTVFDVIRAFSTTGHCIIVGRASNVIDSDIVNALHVRLEGNYAWRLNNVEKSHDYDVKQATAFIKKTDEGRDYFRDAMQGIVKHKTLFSMTVNVSAFSILRTVDLLYEAAKIKGVVI
ncbi:MAG: AAA family ATPase [Bacteroidales bacterium]